ncbi:MAG: hypothetical protein Q7S55_04430 [Nanoarchaeota archaeon]|nr:hypothetical protein [Nanoarchaeota archaeon]
MKVVCIFPITGNSTKYPEILECFQKIIGPQLSILGVEQPEIKFAGTDYTYVPINSFLQGKPKGKGIIEVLKNMPTPPDFVIVCDGSGKIPFENILEIFKVLTSDSSVHCVMANRVGNKAISDFRYVIERFEISVLCRYFKHSREVTDGQCGLWGYRHGNIQNGKDKRIKLTSEGYEIELDLLSECLEQDLAYSLVDVTLPPLPASTNFTYGDNLKKIEFFIKKYPRLEDCLISYADEFEQSTIFLTYQRQVKEQWEQYKRDLIMQIKKK